MEQLNRDLPDNDDDHFWVHCDEKQHREMNQRLALYRIRAREFGASALRKEEHRGIDEANLKAIYPPNVLEDNGYFKSYEHKFDWYFDPQYCNYARFQDYQRLMLRNNGEYEQWEDYRKAGSTLEGDQEFVQLWEKLLSNTKLIEFFLTDNSCKFNTHVTHIDEKIPKRKTYYNYAKKKLSIAKEIGLSMHRFVRLHVHITR
ncbi:hypothetical protein C2845_PM01G22710 [Panicum miliaceum]|uniref:Uncharacterized protein n=1 Tax=Panicum miliaceum TaxID=4540 RepID=A0A3L6TLQ8_PANMI|nr:hypothetical protein C2845_PM01G22710 [Panicum miliaceum]